MPIVAVFALLFGLFAEERAPAAGYACLSVKYRGTLYKARKFERTRLTGSITLTLPTPFDPVAALLGTQAKGRIVQLSGYDAVTDSVSCSCEGLAYRACVDQ